MPDTALLSITYLGPVQYFTKFLIHPYRMIERYDHYVKQSYRNRCNILGANGLLPLSIPVLKGPQHKTYVRDISIDYNKKWQKLHWKGIESAYHRSPFFEFYLDEFKPLYEKKYTYLIDYNEALLDVILESLEIEKNLNFTGSFIGKGLAGYSDYRENIHPKRDPVSDPLFKPAVYHQVFSDRFGFVANLSIIDLLFNEGPNARNVLRDSIKPRT